MGNSLIGALGRPSVKNALFKKANLKKFGKDAKKQLTGINDKYTEVFAPDAVADVARSARGESRTSQRQVKTGRSSTILSMREDLGMDRIGRPNTISVGEMEGATVKDKLDTGKKSEMDAVRKKLIEDTEAIGEKVKLKRLINLGLATPEEQAAFDAKKKKKADELARIKSIFSGGKRIGGL